MLSKAESRSTTTESLVSVIHDDFQVSHCVQQIAERAGYPVAAFDSVHDFLAAQEERHYGCLITGLAVDAVSALDLLAALEQQAVSIPVVFISSTPDFRTSIEVMKRGAVTVLEYPCLDDELCAAIDEAVDRDAQYRQRVNRSQEIRARLAALTDKERRVLDLVIDGVANKVIARQLGVSIRTVESRRQSIFQKMQVQSLAELVKSVMAAR